MEEAARETTAPEPVSPDGLGIDPGPLGLFDPLNLMEDAEGFARRRAVEIKHGRIAMAAFVGMAVQELGVTRFIGCCWRVSIQLGTQGWYGFSRTNECALWTCELFYLVAIVELRLCRKSIYWRSTESPGGYDGSYTIPGGYGFKGEITDPRSLPQTWRSKWTSCNARCHCAWFIQCSIL